MPRIVAYSLCYREGALLRLAIGQVYDLVDEFRVVIGASDVRSKGHPRGCWNQPEDTSSEKMLRSMPDPQDKVRIVNSRFKQWLDKQSMTDAVLEGVNDAIVLQLDADEFWPPELLGKAISTLTNNTVHAVGVRHLLFWGDCRHICRTGEGADLWFKPPRLFRLTPETRIRHLMPALVNRSTDTVIDDDRVCILDTPLWHAAWIGNERVLRKRVFYAEGRGLPMFSVADWKSWKAMAPGEILQINVGPMTIANTPAEYLPSEQLQKEIESAAEGLVYQVNQS
jgi:hypothetical protein